MKMKEIGKKALKFTAMLVVVLLFLGLFTVGQVETVYAAGGDAFYIGNAIHYADLDDSLYINTPLTTQQDNITMETWVKPDTSSAGAPNIRIMYNGHSGGTGYGIYLAGVNKNPSILIGGLAFIYMAEPVTLTTGQWYHLAAVRASGTWKLYINGEEKNLDPNKTVTPNIPTLGFSIGNNNAEPESFIGCFDEVRFWTVARSGEDIRNAMYVQLHGNEAGLLAYYNFDAAVAGGDNTALTSVADLAAAGGANNLTIAKAPGFAMTGTTSNFIQSVQLGQFQMENATYTVKENAGSVDVAITRTGGDQGSVTINYTTANGTAVAGTQYTATTGSVTFAEGQTRKVIAVPITNNSTGGADKNFTMTLSAQTGVTIAAPTSATITIQPLDTKAITSFNFAGLTPGVNGVVNEGAKTIDLTVPFATNVTALVPTITHTGASVLPNTGVAQSFSAPVTYTVTAANGSSQAYTVTVTKPAASTIATVTSGTYTVSAAVGGAGTITNVPFGTSKATFLAALAKGEANQTWTSTSIADPVVSGNTLVVTAQDSTTVITYTVTVNPLLIITGFNFAGLTPGVNGVVNEGAKTIALTVPFATNITALVPTITYTGAGVSPNTGVAQSFSAPVTYTVTGAGGSSQAYTVTVHVIDFAGGSGTVGDPYQITKLEHLNSIRNHLGKHFILMNELNFASDGDYLDAPASKVTWTTGTGWTPIGTNVNKFTGSFNGGGHTVTGLYINAPADATGNFLGLFGYVGTGAEIKNGSLKGVSVTGNAYLGALAGANNGTISGFNAQGSVSGSGYVGGLVGVNINPATISQSYANVTVNVTANRCGGLAGVNSGTISNSYATGSVSGAISGGLVGQSLGGTIENCYATGGVAGPSFTGGLIGVIATTTVTSSYYDSMSSGMTDDAGKGSPRTTAQMKTQGTFTDWDFTTVWDIVATGTHYSYPYLRNNSQDPRPGYAAVTPKAITGFNFAGLAPAVNGVVDEGAKTIALTVPLATNVTALVPTITHTGASLSPNTGVAQNFSGPVTYIVTASDGGNQTYTITVSIAAPTSSTATPAASTPISIMINGTPQSAGTAQTTTQNGQTVTTITVDTQQLENRLQTVGNGAIVTLFSNTNSHRTQAGLTGQMVKQMESREAVLDIKTATASYTLPAGEINIDAVSEQLGEGITLSDIKVNIEIAEPLADTVKIVEDTANKNNYQIVVKPVEFSITCTYGNKTVEVSKFNGYVERTVAIPEGIDPSKITTGIVLNADGIFSHVPTTIIVIDGKYYARIHSLTNSTYSVIYHAKQFNDVSGHWAKNDLNELGSRMIIRGDAKGNFDPYRQATRAELAEMIVKALGIQSGIGKSIFSDVKSTDEYSPYIEMAYEYKIVSGVGNNRFAPEDRITREQVMAMIANAMKVTGLEVQLQDGEMERLLSGYNDAVKASEWAKKSIAVCIKSGIVAGKQNMMIAPKDEITRAEVAVFIKRLLVKSDLINNS